MRSDKCCRSSNVIRRLLRTSERVVRAKTYELTTELLWSVGDSRLRTQDELQLRFNRFGGRNSVRIDPSSGRWMRYRRLRHIKQVAPVI
jgi:hypothetical protein